MAQSETMVVLSRPSIQPLNSLGEVGLKVGITDEQLNQVYADPYITRVAPDDRSMAPVIHPLATYLSAFVNGRFVGAFLAIRYTQHEIESHALLTRAALRHSRQLGDAFLTWAFMQDVMRVTAHIYEYLGSAKNYCLKLGFQEEGFRRCAVVKDGRAVGVYTLGIIRQEWRLT